MTNADARRMSGRRAAKPAPIRPIRNPSIKAPTHVQRTEKEPGSLVLSLGKWFVVQPDGSLREKTDELC